MPRAAPFPGSGAGQGGFQPDNEAELVGHAGSREVGGEEAGGGRSPGAGLMDIVNCPPEKEESTPLPPSSQDPVPWDGPRPQAGETSTLTSPGEGGMVQNE